MSLSSQQEVAVHLSPWPIWLSLLGPKTVSFIAYFTTYSLHPPCNESSMTLCGYTQNGWRRELWETWKEKFIFTDRSALETSCCCPALPALHQIQEAVILRGSTCSLMKDQWPKEDVHYPENRKQSSIGFLTEMGVSVSAKHRREGRKAWRATNHTQNLLWSSAIWLKLGTLWLVEGCESPDPWSIPWEMQMCMSRPESCIPQPWADTHMTRACRCLFMPES